MNCNAVATKPSGDPTGCSGVRMVVHSCTELGQGA